MAMFKRWGLSERRGDSCIKGQVLPVVLRFLQALKFYSVRLQGQRHLDFSFLPPTLFLKEKPSPYMLKSPLHGGGMALC